MNIDNENHNIEEDFEEDTLTMHPLPLLCADGNGRGGGDYYDLNKEVVGYWAYNRIGVTNNVKDIPNDYTELEITFHY